MTDLTFQQQLWLAVVDKAVLATMLVGVGLVANRLLESHKARETLRATLAGERLPRIRAAIEKLEDLRYRSSKRLDIIFWTANRSLRNIGESGDPADIAVARQPINFGDRGLFDGPLGAEFKSVFFGMSADRHALKEEIDVARDLADKDRFWLGKEVMALLDVDYGLLTLRLERPDIAFERERLNRRHNRLPLRSSIEEWLWRRRVGPMLVGNADVGSVDVDRALEMVMHKPR
ncbi:MAG: hypothetical protein M3Z54_14680 [Gemmatimonadota bacterium]|nr:hypothetical protein [Gemmatimonadota bacterium]